MEDKKIIDGFNKLNLNGEPDHVLRDFLLNKLFEHNTSIVVNYYTKNEGSILERTNSEIHSFFKELTGLQFVISKSASQESLENNAFSKAGTRYTITEKGTQKILNGGFTKDFELEERAKRVEESSINANEAVEESKKISENSLKVSKDSLKVSNDSLEASKNSVKVSRTTGFLTVIILAVQVWVQYNSNTQQTEPITIEGYSPKTEQENAYLLNRIDSLEDALNEAKNKQTNSDTGSSKPVIETQGL